MENNRNVSIAGCLIQNTDKTWQPSIGHFMKVSSGITEQIGLNTFFHRSKIFSWVLNIMSKIFTYRFSRFNINLHEGKKLIEVDFVSGAYFFIRNEVLRNIGNFDESFFLFGEEIDFCKRAKLKKYKTFFVPITNITYILNNPSINKIREEVYFYQIVSYYIFFIKHDTLRFNLYKVFTLLTQSILLIFCSLRLNKRKRALHKYIIRISLSRKDSMLEKISKYPNNNNR